MLALFVRIIFFWCEIHGSPNCRTLDSSKHNSWSEMLLKLHTYHALQNMSPPTNIYFEESKINEQLLGECYWFVVSFFFLSRMPGVVCLVNNIVEQTLGEYYWFVVALSFMTPAAVVFITVNRIVEQMLGLHYLFVISFSVMSTIAVVVFLVNNIVE
jgi:hypothetical protein